MKDRQNSSQSEFRTIYKYLRQYKLYLVWGGVAVVLANVLILLTPYITKLIFDALENKHEQPVILKYVLLMVGLAAVSGVFRFMMRRTVIWMSRHIEFDLRNEMFTHLLSLPQSFYHQNRVGDIMARMTNDLEAVRQVVGPGIMYISDTIIKLTVSFAFMIYLSPKLTLYAIIPMILMPLVVNKIANRLHIRSMRVQEKFSEITATAQENLSGIRVVKAYRQENQEIKNFSLLSKMYIKLNLALAKLQGLFFPSMRMIGGTSYLIVFFFGGLEIIHGKLVLGDIVAFFGYLTMILWPMIAIGWVTSLYQRGKASMARINKVLNSQSEVADDDQSTVDKEIKGKIEFKNLSFGYNGTPVLDGINLTINAGQTIGIVGKTGSGKTTLVALIARLFKTNRGQLLIDDIDINDWKLNALRKQIGFAPQEPFLFSDTLFENIRLGQPQSDLERVKESAGIAALSKDIDEFNDGYMTVVGERGITLSGGQKQRTAIARAIIGRPSILILDDATSAVDTETEDQINEEIKKVLEGRTSIIISHRVSSVKEADNILYLEDGRIAEQGNHDQLIKLNGHYAKLYRSQLLEQELEQL